MMLLAQLVVLRIMMVLRRHGALGKVMLLRRHGALVVLLDWLVRRLWFCRRECVRRSRINDTVGTLALGHYDDEDTVAAVIIGTGTNACYLERTDAIIKSQGLLTTSGGMISFLELSNDITDRGGSV